MDTKLEAPGRIEHLNETWIRWHHEHDGQEYELRSDWPEEEFIRQINMFHAQGLLFPWQTIDPDFIAYDYGAGEFFRYGDRYPTSS